MAEASDLSFWILEAAVEAITKSKVKIINS